jgi:hypothetical protein
MIFGSVTTSAQTSEVEAAPNPAITPQTNPLVLRTLWGMTEEEVIATEGEGYTRDESGGLLYSREVAGKEAVLGYLLESGRLAKVAYFFVAEHQDMSRHIKDYNELLMLLRDAYGVPVADEAVWSNDLFRNDRQQWGLAIMAGHLQLNASWQTDDTKVLMALHAEGGALTHAVILERSAGGAVSSHVSGVRVKGATLNEYTSPLSIELPLDGLAMGIPWSTTETSRYVCNRVSIEKLTITPSQTNGTAEVLFDLEVFTRWPKDKWATIRLSIQGEHYSLPLGTSTKQGSSLDEPKLVLSAPLIEVNAEEEKTRRPRLKCQTDLAQLVKVLKDNPRLTIEMSVVDN